MKLYKLILIFFLIGGLSANGQSNLGTLSGTVYDGLDSTTTIPSAKVWLITESGMRGAVTNELGKYKIDALKPGVYNVYIKSVLHDTLTIAAVDIRPNTITEVNGHCDNTLRTVVIYEPVIIFEDIPNLQIPKADLKHNPNLRDPAKMLTARFSEIQQTEGQQQLIIRGSRPGDVSFFVDGIKSSGLGALPGVAIGSLEAYTGAIPASYGDTTGGIVVIETKSYFDLYRAWLYRK